MLVKLSIKELEAVKGVVVKMGKVMDEETSISLTELQDIMKTVNKTNLMNIKFDLVKGLSIWINPNYVCEMYESYGDFITGAILIMKNPVKRLLEMIEDFGERYVDIIEKYSESPKSNKKQDIPHCSRSPYTDFDKAYEELKRRK